MEKETAQPVDGPWDAAPADPMAIPHLERCLLESLLEMLTDRIYFKDLASRFIYGNRAHARLFGLDSFAEIVGYSDADFFATEHAEAAYRDEQEIIRTGRPKLDLEEKETWPDGRVTWCSTSKGPFRDSQGRIVGTFGISRDTTRRKLAEASLVRAERDLRESKALVEAIVDSTPDMIWSVDAERFSVLSFNQRLADYVFRARGVKLRVGMLQEELYPAPEERERWRTRYSRVLESGPCLEDAVTAEGGFMQLRFNRLEREGRVMGISVFCRDTSEARRAEAALRESEAENRALIAAIPDLIFTYSRAGEYLAISASHPELLLVPKEQLLGRNIREALPAAVAGPLAAAISRALDLKAVQELEYSLMVDGAETWFEARLAPGDRERVIAIVRDVSQHRRAEEEHRQLQERVSQVQKLEALGVLVAGVAHNMNNVLAIVMGTASLRGQLTAEPADQEAYRTIGRVSRRGSDVVKSLIQFGKPTLAARAPFELNGLVQDVRLLLGNANRSDVLIDTLLAEEPLWIHGDAGSFTLAMMHLCFNALEAMPQGGGLTLWTDSPEPGWVDLTVCDSGTGMAPEIAERVLEPFYTTKDQSLGAGLGLSMVYGVIKAHGGAMDISSRPGEGTAVRLRLPRVPAPAQGRPAPAVPARHAPALASMTLFLVDDDADVRFLMTRMLKKAGVRQVKTFSGGEELLAELRAAECPDLIILDQNMPGLSGIQTMELVRELHPDMPLLISSGQPDIEAWDCFRRPGVGVISKPFTVDEIQAKLGQF